MQVRYFGPYLGGLRVRRAVTALHRILPLPHAADRLGGAEGDLARVRGAAGSDRAALAASLAAILERQPAAVSWAHRQLEQLRDRAAQTLAYELAARIQAEIGALSWVNLPATGHHHGRGEPGHRGLVRRHAGPVPDPRRAAVRLVTAIMQPPRRHRCAPATPAARYGSRT